MPREAPRHTLNVACYTQLNNAPHDVSLMRVTINIWRLPSKLQATDFYKSTPRETQTHSAITQIALTPKTPKITHTLHEEARRTKDDGAHKSQGGSNNRHNIIYFGKGPRWNLDAPE